MSGTQSNATARSVDSLVGRNRIINGACQIAQRGSFVATTGTTGFGGPDRYIASNGGSAGGQFTQSLSSLSFNGRSCFTILQTVNTAIVSQTTTNYWYGIHQRIEGYNCYDLVNQPITISFIFNTNVSGTYSMSLTDSTNANSYLTTFTAVANTPARYVFTLPARAALSVPISSAIGLYINIGALNQGTYQASPIGWITNSGGNPALSAVGATNWGASAGNFIAMTELQIEAGNIPTPFERRGIQQEIMLCQRYYQTFQNTLYIFTTNTGNFGGALHSVYGVYMRATPTTSAVNINSTGGYTGNISSSGTAPNCMLVWLGTGTQTNGAFCVYSMTATAEL